MNKIQSELGFIGEPSPNFDLVEKCAKGLEEFRHDHSDITAYDCCIFVAQVYAGHKVGNDPESENKRMLIHGEVGCHDDFQNVLTEYLVKNPELINVFSNAVAGALIKIIKR